MVGRPCWDPLRCCRCPGRMASEAERQPLCGRLECSVVDVIVFVFHNHLQLRILTPLLWVFSSMKSSSTILIDMFFILFEISSHFSCLVRRRVHECPSASCHSTHCWAYTRCTGTQNSLVVKSANSFAFNLYERFWAFVL